MRSVCGGQRAILCRDVIGGAIGARGWFPGILLAASYRLVSSIQRTGLTPSTLFGKGRTKTEIWGGVRRRMLGLDVPRPSVVVLRIYGI